MRLQWAIPLCSLAAGAVEDADSLMQLRASEIEACRTGKCKPHTPVPSFPSTSAAPMVKTTVPPTVVAIGEVGSCSLTGDPHIKTFDREMIDTHFYNYGDYWLVKRSDIWVQARYWSTRKDGNSAIRALAISEPRVKGAAWIIEAGGKVTDKPCVDDPPQWMRDQYGASAAKCAKKVAAKPSVCTKDSWKRACQHSCKVCPKASPFTDTIVPCADIPHRGKEAGFFAGTQAEWTRKCEDRTQKFPTLCHTEWAYKVHCKKTCGMCVGTHEERHVVSLSSAPNVSITVTVLNQQGSNHDQSSGDFLNVLLEMPRLDAEQSGHCGNFNGNADDDEPSTVMVDNEELLLAARQWNVVVPPEQHWSDALKAKAREHCEGIIGDGKEDEVTACVIDYCSAGEEAADASVSASASVTLEEGKKGKKGKTDEKGETLEEGKKSKKGK